MAKRQKKAQAKLDLRQEAFDKLSPQEQSERKRPGSLNPHKQNAISYGKKGRR